MATTETTPAPFHRLLAFYSNRNPYDSQTIRLQDSLRGNLSVGLDFPVALAVAIGRHLYLTNTGWFSLDIHVPSVSTTKTLLDGIEVDEKKAYSRAEVDALAKQNGWSGRLDALGLWSLASDVNTGLLRGEDFVRFQRGTLLHELQKRRRNRNQVLPLYRGGPISVAGHSWFVKQLFNVDVYQND
ncbi:hypothetical protein K431DRAFT_282920 [Polychaeton citri CBS 116435]|uniref:Uncharacterized protein n=1 Tax=Polychaeton citri CBS 116435 TaxID=1314669 RepID=A0A9P4QA77_9PEZI|nr:hypothetical protein K431DRAFT_282920 [Polychaeton citri CBS 116435]